MDVLIPLSEVNGELPELEGSACEAFQIQEFWYDGQLEDSVNGAFVQFLGNWHRLYFDHGYVFWRESKSGPRALDVPETKGSYRITDVASRCGLEGVVLSRIRIAGEKDGNIVEFEFQSGACIRIRGLYNDTTSWETV